MARTKAGYIDRYVPMSSGRGALVGVLLLLSLLPLLLAACDDGAGDPAQDAAKQGVTTASGLTGATGGGTETTSTPAGQTTTTVSLPPKKVVIKDAAFDPRSTRVAVGVSVTWTNEDSVSHTVTAYDDSFDSAELAPGESFTHPFTWPGVWAYYCAEHPDMKGSVRVENP